MNRWEYLAWAGILVLCLAVGVGVARWAVPEPVVGVFRFDGAIDFPSAEALTNLLEKARQDPAVAAVVLEVRSPGGLATSSENIFYSMLRLRAEKPVVVVIDGMAASGGYYMASAANRIYAPASAYIGNIGTRGPRPQDPYISPDELSSGPYKLAGGSRFDQINQLDLIKEGFVNNVIAQRLNSPVNPLKLDKKTVEEGRLYLGSEAVAVGLIDLEGARTDGILGAAQLAGLRRYRIEALDLYLGMPVQVQPDYQESIAKMAANMAPDTVFLLDDRIALPGMMDGNALEEHMLQLRDIAPNSWERTSERQLPAADGDAQSAIPPRGDAQSHSFVVKGRQIMRPMTTRLLLAGLGLLLLLTPLFVRTVIWGMNERPYVVGQVPITNIAATPIPTTTPVAVVADSMLLDTPMRPGPVVVDLAHGNRLERSQFEPLASALARRGVGTRFWLSSVDVMSISNYLDYPDQSAELGPLLEDATALVVVSPFFLWTKPEIALVERFVADGGHLLIVSDPDVVGDLAQDVNTLGEPFGVVFHDDYLYDTTTNDGNYTFIQPNDFQGEAERLASRSIALYGARSIGGEVTPLLRTAFTTLSSIRSGLTNFTIMGLGGLETSGTLGRVLALSDFDVLTNSYVERKDNKELVEFVAGYLAAAQRQDTITDFPAYLGKNVALVFGNADAVDAQILMEGAYLQSALEATGRSLTLAGSTMLTETLTAGSVAPDADMIVLAEYSMISEQTQLLRQLGFRRIVVTPAPEATITPTLSTLESAPATATPTPTISIPGEDGSSGENSLDAPEFPDITKVTPSAQEIAASDQITPAVPPTITKTLTDTVTPEVVSPTETPTPTHTPSVTPTATPAPVVYLEKTDGLRLVARQTVIIAQLSLSGQHRLVAVLGEDNAGIQDGVERLMTRNYAGCLTGPDLVVCSFEGSPEATPAAEEATAEPTATETPASATEPTAVPAPSSPEASAPILIIDDNDMATANDISEADSYLVALTQAGYAPNLWVTADQNTPPDEELQKYRWVIWSSGGYEDGGPSVSDLDVLLNYINNGGWLTISSRRPFFAMSTEDPSVIVDVTVENEAPELVAGLPPGTIPLENGLPPVTPLEINDELEGPLVALRRGPDSGNPGAPLLFVASDAGSPDATGARLMILGMSLNWLPNDVRIPLVQNMATVMLAQE